MRTCLAALTLLLVFRSGVGAFDVCGMDSPGGDNEVQGMVGRPAYFDCSKDDRCKGYVVLVTFRDTNTGWYANDDQPYGYSWDLFNQFFNGGYDPDGDGPATTLAPYTGNIVAGTEAVFGSVRAYFNEVYGEDIVEFEILNDSDTNGLPMWLELPSTKHAYGNLVGNDLTFWDDAEAAVRANAGNVLKSVPTGFPFKTTPVSPADTLLKNKAIYVYAGLTLGNGSPLHPRVDQVTRSSTSTGGIGARMVIGERQGWHTWGDTVNTPDNSSPRDTDHTVDRFTGVGIHVHEWGHLFGLVHPNGQWSGTNPHPNPDQPGDFNTANTMGWGAMQAGEQGPVITGQNHYRLPYRSCPNPYNPFYRMDLGWNTVDEITTSAEDKKIRPGPAQIYVVPSVNDQDYLLDFRDVSTSRDGDFGQYAAYKKLSSSGLLIWRRRTGTNDSNPMLIPADGRSIFDARRRNAAGDPTRDPSDIMFDDLPADLWPRSTVTEATSILEDHFTTNNTNPRVGNGGANPPFGTIGPSYLAFRNIEIKSDSEGAYAEVDIRFIPLPPTSLGVTAAPTEADPSAVTLSWNAPDPNGTDRILGYQYSTDGGTTWHPSLAANPLALITSSPAPITGLAATDLTFQMRTVTDHPNSAEGIGPDIDNLSPASDTIVLNRPGRVELTAVEPTSHTPPTVGDELIATVRDANVSDWADADISWRWQRSADGTTWHSAGTSTPLNSTNTATYELRDADVGQQVRVIAEYSDGVFRDPDTAESNSVTVNSRPVVGTALVALLTDEDGNISVPVAGWQWQRKQPDETEWEDITAPAVGNAAETPPTMHRYTPTAADINHELRVKVSYTDGYGEEEDVLTSAATTGVVTGSNRPPTLTGKPVVPVAENSQRVGDYTAGDPDGDAVTWLVLTGSDPEAFELTGTNQDAKRTLQFKADALPNFEQKTRYSVTLTVESTPGSGSVGEGGSGAHGVPTTALTVAVDITNAEDVGEVVLSPLPPQVDVPLQATLADEDGQMRDMEWDCPAPRDLGGIHSSMQKGAGLGILSPLQKENLA